MATRRPDLARHRESLGLTKIRLAQLLGVNRATVHRWEAGESVPRADLRSPLARALQLDIRELNRLLQGDDTSDGLDPTHASVVSTGVATVYREEVDGEPVDRRQFISGMVAAGVAAALPFDDVDPRRAIQSLESAIGRTVRLEQRSQYAALSAVLPAVIVDAERTVASTAGRLQLEATRQLVMAKMVAAFVLIKLDRPDDAQATATDALTAAHAVNDPVLVGTVLRCLAETHMRGGTYELAADLAVEGASHIARHGATDPAALAAQGAALLTAATAFARHGERQPAMELLEAATRCSDEIRHDVIGSIVFGPTNVAIHRVALEIELGDPIEALRHADQNWLTTNPAMAERRARYLLDVARAQAQLDHGADAIETLLAAESIASEEIRTHRHSRSVLTGLVEGSRSGLSMELRPLAQRCGALVT